MIARLIEACALRPALMIFGALALGLAGFMAMQEVELDAMPDLSDTQVIVYTEWMGRSPTLVEDQVTAPLVSTLLGAANVHDVRGQSMFGMSFVYVVFGDGTPLGEARSRVLELLETATRQLPQGATPRLGPDASGVGWVLQYAVTDRLRRHDASELRLLHDTTIRLSLASVPGVAEVATVGGALPEWQVIVDPLRLTQLGMTPADVRMALAESSAEVGGGIVELSEHEVYVRGKGYFGSAADIEAVALRTDPNGVSVRVGDVGEVRLGPAARRGAADLEGDGEAVSGIVVMRPGENALDVIGRVKTRLAGLAPSLPEGVAIKIVYDRSQLIDRAIDTLEHALIEEMIVVALAILLFLLHIRSALLPIISLPLAVLFAFLAMQIFGMPATIMSLGGIAIAIGATVDAEIVMIEAAHKKLEGLPPNLAKSERERLLAEAAREVTPAIFFSLLIVAVSFLPVFGLTGQAGRLFRPLVFTKTAVMLGAALLSVTLAPALRNILVRGKIRSEEHHPISRAIRKVYEPFVHVALRRPITTILIGLFAILSVVPLLPKLGREFMPALDEGDLLYMPSTLPGISLEEAKRVLQIQDTILMSFPEVESVIGKAGRADSPTDPAPLAMVETVVRLKQPAEWRTRFVRRWYHGREDVRGIRPLLEALEPEFVPMTRADLVAEMDAKLQLVGWRNAFTQPIRNRIDMLATGIRTPVGLKIRGRDLAAIERAGLAIEPALRGVSGTTSVIFERQRGGLYLDVTPNRDALAKAGLTSERLFELIEGTLGGTASTSIVDGRARFGVAVRLADTTRSDVSALEDLPIQLAGEEDAPARLRLKDLASIRVVEGPSMIRDDGGSLVGYIYVTVDDDQDLAAWLTEAQRAVASVPGAGEIRWTGQFEQMDETAARMKLLIPLALLLVILLLYFQFGNFTEVLIVLLSVPFALVGSVWLLFLMDFHRSTAVDVGIIALIGLAAQTGVVMIVYIDHAYEKRLRAGRIRNLADIVEAHAEGTIQRVRPKLMTVGTMLIGLIPLLFATGSGADVMKRIAAPMVGGLITSLFLTLEIIPVIYTYWRNEQRVHLALATREPALLAELTRLVWIIRGGGMLLVAALAAALYLPAPHNTPIAAAAAVAGATALVAGFALYIVVRLRARPFIDNDPNPTPENAPAELAPTSTAPSSPGA